MNNNPAIFEDYKIRRIYDEETETSFKVTQALFVTKPLQDLP